jgi:hypothetical protein
MRRIHLWLICFLIGSLSGCASSPVEIPEWDLTPVESSAQQPLSRPELPSPVSSTEDTVTFSLEAFRVLLDIVDIADGNYTIAQENAAAADTQGEAYNQLIEVGKLQRSFTQIREEQLARERRDHFIDNWFHRGLIALGILVAL